MDITFEQLPQAVSQLYNKLENIEKILSAKSTPQTSNDEELLTVQDAAKFLSLSVPTIYTLISKGELPVMKRSKRCYFSKIELMDYVKLGRNKTNAEIKSEANFFVKNKAK